MSLKITKTKNHPFEDYDSGNLLGFFSPLRKLHAKDTTYRTSLNNTTPRQEQGNIGGGHSVFALLCSIFNFFVPLDEISEMLIDGGCGGAGRGERKAESSTNTRLQADS